MNNCSKVTGHKINMQKSIVFLYTNNEQSKIEIKEKILLKIVINFKKVEGLYIDNYKYFLRNLKISKYMFMDWKTYY